MTIYRGIYGPYGSSNGACMRAYMAIYGSSEWGMYARIHGPYMGAYMGHMGAVMGYAYAHTWAIYGGSLIGRVGRKGTAGNPFPSLVVPAPSLPLPSLLEGKGAGVIPFPSLPCSAA